MPYPRTSRAEASLPTAPGGPLPQISESVLLTHLRTEAQAAADISLTAGSDAPGVALPGGGTGKAYRLLRPSPSTPATSSSNATKQTASCRRILRQAGFRAALLDYLAGSYDEIRDGAPLSISAEPAGRR